MKKFLIAFFGGLFVVMGCAVALYFDGKTSEEIVKALLLEERPRLAFNIPFGYFLIAISPLVLLYEVFCRKNRHLTTPIS